MKAVYIVKQAVATGLGSSIQENWDRLIKGESAIAAVAPRHANRSGGRRAAIIADLVPDAGENRVCAVARRVLDRIRPVPPNTCIVWTGLKGNAEYIEAGGKKAIPFLPEHYRRWVAELLDNRRPGARHQCGLRLVHRRAGDRRPKDCPGRIWRRSRLCGRRGHRLCGRRFFGPEGVDCKRLPSF